MTIAIGALNPTTIPPNTTIPVSGTAPPNTALKVWVENVNGSEKPTTSNANGSFSVQLSFPTPTPGGNFNVCVQETSNPNRKIVKKAVMIQVVNE